MGENSRTPAEHIADAEGLLRGSNTTQEHFDRVVAGFEEKLTTDERYALMTRLEQQSQGAQTSALIAIAKLFLPETRQGICGDQSRSVWTGEWMAPQTCRIPAGHSGWHRSAQGMEWTDGENTRTCGFRWSWPDGEVSHFEICTEPVKHSGDHRNSVTGIAHVPTKPVADQLHELVSYCRAEADRESHEAETAREHSGLTARKQFGDVAADAYKDAAEKLEAILMEGGL